MSERNNLKYGLEIIPADDNGLELLIDYCVKRVATVGGDGYKEIVLYRNKKDGTYQVHTYNKQNRMQKEIHHAYTSNKFIKDKIYKIIEQLNLAEYKGKKGIGLMGAEYIVKFKQNDNLIRISTDNLDENGRSTLEPIGKILYDAITEQLSVSVKE